MLLLVLGVAYFLESRRDDGKTSKSWQKRRLRGLKEGSSLLEGISNGWTAESYPLPAAANGANIKIEFLLESNDNGQEFAGFYIDDVMLEAN